MDVPNRDELEAELARDLSGALRKIYLRLLQQLGDPPDWRNLDPFFWDAAADDLGRVIEPGLQKIFEAQALIMVGTVPMGVDWALVNRAAVNWARSYGFDLVSRINDTTRAMLQSTIADAFERGLTRGEIVARISPSFGPVRAEMIAVTEVTRASVEGERASVGLLEASTGVKMIPKWETNNDEIAMRCPICWPRHDKVITDDIYPPGHIRCRCWLIYLLPETFTVAPEQW